MLIKIILWASIIWLLPFLYVVQRNEAKFKKNIVVGATLPQEARDDPEVQALLQNYLKETKIICIALGIAVIPCWLPESFNWLMFAWMLWIDALIVLTQIPFIKCNNKLRELKNERGWNRKASDEVPEEKVTVNMANISSPKWLSPWVFAGAFIITLVPIALDPSLWPVVVIFALTQIMFYFFYRYAFRTKSEAIDDNMEITQALTQIRRSYWARIWIKIAYSTALFSLGTLLLKGHGKLYFWLTILYSIYAVFVVATPEFRIRKVQEKLTRNSGTGEYVDDDDYWVWGMFYYNPRDSHSFVNGRVGVGNTVNVAMPFGKFMCIFALITLVMMPAFPFLMDWSIENKVVYVQEEQHVTVSCGRSDIRVDLEHVAEVSLVDEYEEVSPLERSVEYIMLGMRTSRGISRRDYVDRCQCDWRPIEQVLRAFEAKGWVRQTGDRWHFTVPGFLISNTLIGIMLETQASGRIEGTPWLSDAEYASLRVELPKGEEELFTELYEQQKKN